MEIENRKSNFKFKCSNYMKEYTMIHNILSMFISVPIMLITISFENFVSRLNSKTKGLVH